MKVNDDKLAQVLAKENFLELYKVQFVNQFYLIFSKKRSRFSIRRCNSVNYLADYTSMLLTTEDFDGVANSLEDSAKIFFE